MTTLRVLEKLTSAEVPCAVLDIDLEAGSEPSPPPSHNGATYRSAWVLLRRRGVPVGAVAVKGDGGPMAAEHWRAALLQEVPGLLAEQSHTGTTAAAARSANAVRPEEPLGATGGEPLETTGDQQFPAGPNNRRPPVTVAVCTRERPDGLARCLESLTRLDYPRYSVLVVDNAPATDRTKSVVENIQERLAVQYLHEPVPGLSVARNRVLKESEDEVIAWLDDDEVADPTWLTALVTELVRVPGAAVACGVMVPAALETAAQVWFEEWGGHSKRRGFERQIFSLGTLARAGAVYPFPAFGSGGNMALQRSPIVEIGGFDRALGAGSPARSAEDTLAFTELILQGRSLVYQPAAVTHHFHREDVAGLRAQLYGYGAGLSAFYAALLWAHPALTADVLRLVPRAAVDMRSSSSSRNAGFSRDFPAEVLKANKRGIAAGSVLYAKGRLALRSTGLQARMGKEEQ